MSTQPRHHPPVMTRRHTATIGRRVATIAVAAVGFFILSDAHNFVTDSHITLPAHAAVALIIWGPFASLLAVGYARKAREATAAPEDGPA
jgi:hypothetical protein